MRNDRPSSAAARRPGFTLIELLVVIGIIALIGSILLVTMSRARKSGDKFRLGAQLQMIEQGLEAYRTDFNALPVTALDATGTTADDKVNAEGLRGARTLCKALMGPAGGTKPPPTVGAAYPDKADQDGKTGFGFAVPGRSGVTVTADGDGNLKGKTYGPYLSPDTFRVAKTFTAATSTKAAGDLVEEQDDPTGFRDYDDTTVLLDANGKPILYYPILNAQPPVRLQYAYVSRGRTTTVLTSALETYPTLPSPDDAPFVGTPMYNSTDNGAWLAAPMLRRALGDVRNAQGAAGADGAISPATATLPAEVPAVRGKYILWTAGPDGVFGINPAAKPNEPSDDVNNLPAP